MFDVGTLPKFSGGLLSPFRTRYHMAPKQLPRLWVITLANPKGGVGKTTIASALAVRAAAESKRVALLDLDPQESLASWWIRRGKTKNPKLFEVDAAVEAIEMLISEGWEWVFVDTGPARIDLIEAGIAVADLVLIPTRPSAFDIEQTAICVELCENHSKAHAFVLNHAPSGAKVSKLTRSSIKFLQKNGSTVIDAPLTYQEAYMAAATVGKSAPEVERGDDAHKEIEALWAVVKKLLVGKVS
jgi:chromosome partitioning protein